MWVSGMYRQGKGIRRYIRAHGGYWRKDCHMLSAGESKSRGFDRSGVGSDGMKSKWTASIASFFSSLLAIVCPLCIPALGAFLASVGLGFAINVWFLQSLLILLLFLAIGSLIWSAKGHKQWWIVCLGMLGAALIYVGRYIWFSQILMVAGALILIGISLINIWLKARCNQCA